MKDERFYQWLRESLRRPERIDYESFEEDWDFVQKRLNKGRRRRFPILLIWLMAGFVFYSAYSIMAGTFNDTKVASSASEVSSKEETIATIRDDKAIKSSVDIPGDKTAINANSFDNNGEDTKVLTENVIKESNVMYAVSKNIAYERKNNNERIGHVDHELLENSGPQTDLGIDYKDQRSTLKLAPCPIALVNELDLYDNGVELNDLTKHEFKSSKLTPRNTGLKIALGMYGGLAWLHRSWQLQTDEHSDRFNKLDKLEAPKEQIRVGVSVDFQKSSHYFLRTGIQYSRNHYLYEHKEEGIFSGKELRIKKINQKYDGQVIEILDDKKELYRIKVNRKIHQTEHILSMPILLGREFALAPEHSLDLALGPILNYQVSSTGRGLNLNELGFELQHVGTRYDRIYNVAGMVQSNYYLSLRSGWRFYFGVSSSFDLQAVPIFDNKVKGQRWDVGLNIGIKTKF